MGMEIFRTIIHENGQAKAKAAKGIEKEDNNELLDNEAEKIKLLALIPEELRERSIRENFSIDHIKEIIDFREKKGYKTVLGFHVSPYDLKVGASILAGGDTNIYFSTDLESLYAGKKPQYIYAIECSEKSMKVLDESLSWYTTRGELKIIDKIKMTHEAVSALGVKFSECVYS